MESYEIREYEQNYVLEKLDLDIQFRRMKTYGEMGTMYILMFAQWVCTGFLFAVLFSRNFFILVLVFSIVALLVTIFYTIMVLKFYVPCSVEDKESHKSKKARLISPDELQSLLSGENADFVIKKCREVMKDDKPLYFEDLCNETQRRTGK